MTRLQSGACLFPNHFLFGGRFSNMNHLKQIRRKESGQWWKEADTAVKSVGLQWYRHETLS